MTSDFILQELHSVADAQQAKFLQGFFKTGKGQYGEGDVFLGIRVPVSRDIVRANKGVSISEISKLLDSKYHEARFVGLLLLVQDFRKAKTEKEKRQIFDFYIANARKANNWDLVDCSCRDIVGGYLLGQSDRPILYQLANNGNLWEQRIAIVSTWMFIKHKDYDDILRLSEILLHHPHDLMQKATGWMLREVGKKDRETLTEFLEKYYRAMPRTTLRYAIEHYSPEEREHWMRKI